MIPLTEQEKIEYQNTTSCPNCKNDFASKFRIKVRHNSTVENLPNHPSLLASAHHYWAIAQPVINAP